MVSLLDGTAGKREIFKAAKGVDTVEGIHEDFTFPEQNSFCAVCRHLSWPSDVS
jgi:hypothetical protein